MGANLSSPTFGSLAYLKNAYTPDSTLAPISRWRVNLTRATSQGHTQGCHGGLLMLPDARMIGFVVIVLLNYNTIQIGKWNEDTMNTTIDKRHGYDNFRAFSSQDQARIKGYVRSEWLTGMNLDETKRFSPETRVNMLSNAQKLA